ncbi:MAG: cytochrome c oxidase subunit II [Alphaproteobacteria bacterium]
MADKSEGGLRPASFFWAVTGVAVLTLLLGLGSMGGPALAAQPEPWQMGMQPAATPIKAEIEEFHNLLLVIITAISVFVLALLIYVMVRFNARRNPEPGKFTHNTAIEVIWTIVPVIILIVIAIPSFRLLYFNDVVPESDMTIKAVGHQWYWSYEYPDHGDFAFDSFMKEDGDLLEGEPRLLSVDNDLVVPVGKTVRLQVTSTDVLHSFAVPAFGIKIDSVPGRLNETWFRIDRPGMYYGQCSEICGVNHGFMPIAVRALPEEEFNAWLKEAQAEFAGTDFDPEQETETAPVKRLAAVGRD